MGTELEWIADRARDPGFVFMNLAHHLDELRLRSAYRRVRKDGAWGVDGVTGEAYGRDLDTNLRDLHARLRGRQYKAPPVERAWIPKASGGERPIGVPTFEDKVVQRAVVDLLEPVYEATFHDFSYGFRRGRRAHDALRALRQAVMEEGIRWIVDADIEGFFDHIHHGLLQGLIQRRVSDRGMLRLTGRWLRAGVLEAGQYLPTNEGTPQGGVVSPLLANIYLHYALDAWYVEEVRPRMRGHSVLIRFADDFVAGFALESDARRFLAVLEKRLARFHLRLHPEKTRLLDFGRGSDATFTFLGFGHYWARSRRGYWVVKRRTAKGRVAAFARSLHAWCRANRHTPVAWQHAQLAAKLRGHYAYFGVRTNLRSLEKVRESALRSWRHWLCRRSQHSRMGWDRWSTEMKRFALPAPRIIVAWA